MLDIPDEDEETGREDESSGGDRSCSPWPQPPAKAGARTARMEPLGEDDETGREEESAGSRSCSPWPQSAAKAASRTGPSKVTPQSRQMFTPSRLQPAEPSGQLRRGRAAESSGRERPRRGRAAAAGDGRSRGQGLRGSALLRGAEVTRGRLNLADAPRGRLRASGVDAFTGLDAVKFTAAHRTKERLPPRQLARQRDRDRSAARPRREDALKEPCEDNCYAYSLAGRIDIRRLETLWLQRRAASVAATAQAVAKAVAAAARNRQNAQPAAAAAYGSHAAPGGVRGQGHEVQVVRLNKEICLLKVGRKDVFVFSFGCLVCWGCTLHHALCAKEYISDVLQEMHKDHDVDEDSIMIASRDGRSAEVCLSARDAPTFERVALAYALAQSVCLGSLELRIDRAIAATRPIPETLARTGHVELNSQQVTKMIGELFVLRNQVNLHTDILDTPEIFWEYEDYEPLYLMVRQHLDMEKRVSILNQRFLVLQDLFDVLESELTERKASRLEWIVIILLALEGLVMAFRLYARCYLTGPGQPSLFLPILGPVGYIFKCLKSVLLGS